MWAEGRSEVVSLKGSRRHAGICVTVMMVKEREKTGERFRVGRPFFTLGLQSPLPRPASMLQCTMTCHLQQIHTNLSLTSRFVGLKLRQVRFLWTRIG